MPRLTAMIVDVDSLRSKAQLVRSNDTYDIWDIYMQELTLSMTVLHEGRATTGHSHDQTEEIYNFTAGTGEIDLGNESPQPITAGDLVLIPRGIFHKVTNKGKRDLIFVCVFQKYDGMERSKCTD